MSGRGLHKFFARSSCWAAGASPRFVGESANIAGFRGRLIDAQAVAGTGTYDENGAPSTRVSLAPAYRRNEQALPTRHGPAQSGASQHIVDGRGDDRQGDAGPQRAALR